MTKLIEKNDSRYFSQTSDEPYDRHHYKIVSKHYATFIVESWDEVQEWWWNHCNMINFDARIESQFGVDYLCVDMYQPDNANQNVQNKQWDVAKGIF